MRTPIRFALMSAALASAFAHAVVLAAAPAPDALPSGSQVVAGQAGINSQGANMQIRQSSDKAIVNWQSFNIGSNAQVNVLQDPHAVLLNRVIGADPSAIFGRLNATGQVFLLNPQGVLFGAGARVDVGGLVASTLDIRNGDFLDGRLRFAGSSGNGSIVNQGELKGGFIALMGTQVVNEGQLLAGRQGSVALAAGESVTLSVTSNNLVEIEITPATVATLVENKGLIQTDGGQVMLTARTASQLLQGVVNNSGTISADSIISDGGRIRLDSSHRTSLSGSLSASAGEVGTGGQIAVWSDGHTHAGSSITARGGAVAGDGGFIETSGATLDFTGIRVDAGASHGRKGNWLIDPVNLTIDALLAGNISASLTAGSDVTVSTSACGAPFACGVLPEAEGDINVLAPIGHLAPPDPVNQAHLTLSADRDINVANGVIIDNGFGAITLNARRNIGVGDDASVLTLGSLSLSAGSAGLQGRLTLLQTAAPLLPKLAGGGISLTADRMGLSNNASLIPGPMLSIKPFTPGTQISLGVDAGNALVLPATLGQMIDPLTGLIRIGDAATGRVNIGGELNFASPLLVQSASNIGLASVGRIASTAIGDAVTLAAGTNFIAAAGGQIILAPDGRWLIFSTRPADTQQGDLVEAFVRTGCTFAGGCGGGAPIPLTGNGLIFSEAPPPPPAPGGAGGIGTATESASIAAILSAQGEAVPMPVPAAAPVPGIQPADIAAFFASDTSAEAGAPRTGVPLRIVRPTLLPRARLADVWPVNAQAGQKRQLVIVLPVRAGGNSAVTLRAPQGLEATLLDQAFSASVGNASDVNFYSLEAEDVRRSFSELMDDMHTP